MQQFSCRPYGLSKVRSFYCASNGRTFGDSGERWHVRQAPQWSASEHVDSMPAERCASIAARTAGSASLMTHASEFLGDSLRAEYSHGTPDFNQCAKPVTGPGMTSWSACSGVVRRSGALNLF
jgi:hypothetical protein